MSHSKIDGLEIMKKEILILIMLILSVLPCAAFSFSASNGDQTIYNSMQIPDMGEMQSCVSVGSGQISQVIGIIGIGKTELEVDGHDGSGSVRTELSSNVKSNILVQTVADKYGIYQSSDFYLLGSAFADFRATDSESSNQMGWNAFLMEGSINLEAKK